VEVLGECVQAVGVRSAGQQSESGVEFVDEFVAESSDLLGGGGANVSPSPVLGRLGEGRAW
jgi:hypothetical protein